MLRVFLPVTCLACNRAFDRQKHVSVVSRYLCPNCLRMFEQQTAQCADGNEKLFRFKNIRAPHTLHAAFEFRQGSIIQQLIHNAKYHSMMKLASALGEITATALAESLQDIDHIIPIPLHRARYSERGYNQSEKMAKGISKVLGSATVLPKVVQRVKPTPTQTGLSEDEREENMNGAFALRANTHSLIKDKTILLVDDVMTTGATLASAGQEIDKAEPKKIIIVAVALATDSPG